MAARIEDLEETFGVGAPKPEGPVGEPGGDFMSLMNKDKGKIPARMDQFAKANPKLFEQFMDGLKTQVELQMINKAKKHQAEWKKTLKEWLGQG